MSVYLTTIFLLIGVYSRKTSSDHSRDMCNARNDISPGKKKEEENLSKSHSTSANPSAL